MNRRLFIVITAAAVLVVVGVSAFLLVRRKSSSVVVTQDKSASLAALLNQAKELEAKGLLMEAKTVYQNLVNEFPNLSSVMEWQKKTEELNVRSLFSPALTPDKSIIYEIKPGDALIKIAKQFKTTVELIKKMNNISDDIIVPGRKIKVWTAPFAILVDKSQNLLILKSQEEIFKTYTVATGKNGSTPVGNFKIVNKLVNPAWFKAGAVVPADSPENILGSRWLGFNLAGYGIHGTNDPQSLGQQATQGCIRMSNTDVEEIYTIVPVGSEVTIVE